MKTSRGLATFAERSVDITPYIYGTYGQILTERKLAELRKMYPERFTDDRYKYARDHYINKRTTDCYGLFKRYKWTGGDAENPSLDENPIYNAKEDISANQAYERAKVKGPISTLPEVRGLAVRYPGHVGVYIGNGKVVEARGFNYGTVITNLKDRKWTHWFQEDGISYDEEPIFKEWCRPTVPVLKRGDKGPQVGVVQYCLNKAGYTIEIDQSFGPKTEEAVKNYQEKMKLKKIQSGIVGVVTWNKLINS